MKQSKQNVDTAIKECYDEKSQALNLCRSGLCGLEIVLLFNRRDWSNLRQLNLSFNGLEDKDCNLIASIGFKQMISLNLSSNKITEKGVSYICKQQWKVLKTLNIGNNAIQDSGIGHLLNKQFNNLINLSANQCKLNPNTICMMVDIHAGWIRSLLELDLNGNNIGVKGAQCLSKIDLQCLNKLTMQNCRLYDQAFIHISKANWPALTICHFCTKNKLNLDSIISLTSNNWHKIKQIRITNFMSHTLHFVITNWPSMSSGFSQLSSIRNVKMHKMVNIVFKDKFKIRLQ